MDDLGNLLDLPSPASSLYYVYGDPEQYGSGSQSPSTSAVSLLRFRDRHGWRGSDSAGISMT